MEETAEMQSFSFKSMDFCTKYYRNVWFIEKAAFHT